MAHDAVASGLGQKLAAEAHQAPCRYIEYEPDAALVFIYHVGEDGAAGAEIFHNGAHVFLGYVNGKLLDGLKQMSLLITLHDDLRTGYCKFIALAAHGFNKYGEVEFAPAADLEGIGGCGRLHAHCDIRFDFLEKPITDIAAGDVFALPACKGAGIYDKIHTDGGLVDMHKGQGFDGCGVADRLTDGYAGNTCKRDYIADADRLGFNSFQPLEPVKTGKPCFAMLLVICAAYDYAAVADGNAALNLSDAYPADVIIIINGGDEHLKRFVFITHGRGNMLDNGIEDGLHAVRKLIRLVTGNAVACGGIDDGEVELIIVCAELNKEV